jgi:hypothetical protein
MASLSDYTEAHVLDTVFSAAAWPTIATHYIALYTVLPTDVNASGTEVSGGSYARCAVTNNATTWPAATGSNPTSKSNGIAFTFAAPTANWGTVVGFAVYDALTVGNELCWAPLTVGGVVTTKVINNGDSAPSFAIGTMTITLD